MKIEPQRADNYADTTNLLKSKLNKKEWKALRKHTSKIMQIAVSIGGTIEKAIYNEGLEFSSKNKDIDELKKIDATSWVFFIIIISFISQYIKDI